MLLIKSLALGILVLIALSNASSFEIKAKQTARDNNDVLIYETALDAKGNTHNKRTKRWALLLMEALSQVVDLGFGIYNAFKDSQGGQEQQENFQQAIQGIERNYGALRENYAAINNVGYKVDHVIAATYLFNMETRANLNNIRRDIVLANAERRSDTAAIRNDIERTHAETQKTLYDIRSDLEHNHRETLEVLSDIRQDLARKHAETQAAVQNVRDDIKNTHAETLLGLSEVKLDIFKLNRQLLRQFEGMHDTLREMHSGDKLSNLITFMDYYWQRVAAIEQLSQEERAEELEANTGVLFRLEEAIAPNGQLHANIQHILNQRLAMPQSEADVVAFATLSVLYYALRTYVAAAYFVLEQRAFLANFYYDKADINSANKQLGRMLSDYNAYSLQLLGLSNTKGGSGAGRGGLIKKTLELYLEVQQLPYVYDNKELLQIFRQQMLALQQDAALMATTRLPFLNAQPAVIKRKPDFSATEISTPIGEWVNGVEVSYAVQYAFNGSYSKIGPWSKPYRVSTKACPQLVIPTDSSGYKRLILRKFNDNALQLAGILTDTQASEFRDINRDLYNAAGNLNEDIGTSEFEILLKNGASINATFEDDQMSIHAAAAAGNAALMSRFLLNSTAVNFINVQDSKGNTPLHVAAQNDYAHVVQLLLQHGADVNVETKTTALTPLHVAALNGFESVIAALIAGSNINVNIRDANGFRPLHHAVYGGRRALDALLAHKAIDVNAQSNAGLMALQLAVLNGKEEIMQRLLNCDDIDINAQSAGGFTALHYAVINKNFEHFQLLMQQPKIDVNLPTINGWTALHFVVALQQQKMLTKLLQHPNVVVNAKAAGNVLPLHLAATLDQAVALTQLLAANSTAIDATTKAGLTPLHMAALFGKPYATAKLIEHGANTEATTTYKFNGNMCSYARRQYLLYSKQNCAGVEIIKYDSLTPLLLAASTRQCNVAVLQLLLNSGAKPAAKANDGKTFDFMAAQHGSLYCADYIVTELNGLNRQALTGDSLLHFAVRGHNLPVVRYLIESKHFSLLNTKNNNYETVLHFATLANDAEMLQYLLGKGAPINAQTKFGQTCLHLAVENFNYEITKILVSQGADTEIKDAAGRTPFDYAPPANIAQILLQTSTTRDTGGSFVQIGSI